MKDTMKNKLAVKAECFRYCGKYLCRPSGRGNWAFYTQFACDPKDPAIFRTYNAIYEEAAKAAEAHFSRPEIAAEIGYTSGMVYVHLLPNQKPPRAEGNTLSW